MIAKSRRSSNDGDISITKKMFIAIRKGYFEECQRIFVHDMKSDEKLLNQTDDDDDDEEKNNCIAEACMAGHLKILEYLLDKGGKLQTKSVSGLTPLHYAAKLNHVECLRLCLERSAKMNEQTHFGSTPIISAARIGNAAVIEVLLQKGADPNIDNVDGQTALIISACLGHLDCVNVLINGNADVNIKDDFGWTALTLAREKDKHDCIKALEALIPTGRLKDEGPPKYPIDTDFSAEKISKMNEIQDVDEMKIQTMYKMVDECRIISQGKEVVKKVLYLTNKQAVMFDEDAMERAVQALDIGEPKFVIKLISSLGVASQMMLAHPEEKGTAYTEFMKSSSVSSEINKIDERVVETQVLLFMKTCILPLAMQTRALILVNGANDCYLSVALSRVAVAEQARLGKDCPFTVIATASEIEVHAKAVSPNPNDSKTVAAQLARQSQAWKKRIGFMHNFYSDKLLSLREKLQQCDLTEAASRYIIFEGYEEGNDEDDDGSFNRGPQKIFESVFLQYMTRKLPSIAIQCLEPGQGTPFLVDLTSRNIPVLLLDTTERCFTITKNDRYYDPLTTLATISEAFPNVSFDIFKMIKSDKMDDGILSFDGKCILLEIAQEINDRKLSCLANHNTCDSLSSSTLAFFHSVLTFGSNAGLSSIGSVPLYLRVREMEKFERTSKDLKKVSVSPELATKVMEYIQSRTSALDIYCRLARVDYWLDNHDKTMNRFLFDAIEYKKHLIEKRDEIESNAGLLASYDLDSATWLAYYDILTSPNTYSGSIFDIDEIKRILGSVAKIDRLPTANSLEALRMLQDAWDHVEVYNLVAVSYKGISKVTYVLMLIIGVTITFFSLTEANKLDYDARIPVIILSFIGTAIASYISWTNPAIKWQQLRMAALSIESNIWTFRTRAGPYRTSGEGFDNSSESFLSDILKDIKEKVLEGADIKNTAFYSRIKSQNKHGQHPPGVANFGALDNFAQYFTIEELQEYEKQKSNKASNLFCFFCNCFSKIKEKSSRDIEADIESVLQQLSSKQMRKRATFLSMEKKEQHHNEEHESLSSHELIKNKPPKTKITPLSSKKVKIAANIHPFTRSSSMIERSMDALSDDDGSSPSVDDDVNNVVEPSKSLPLLPYDTIAEKEEVIKTIKLSDALAYLRKDANEIDILTVDSHYEPLQPDAYIRFRVLPMIRFYKNRIPKCNRTRNTTQLLLVAGTIATAFLAIANITVWASGVTIVTASITAYLEFSGTNSKIARYSFTVHALQELVYWWQTLPQIDRSVVANIDRLVLTCEELLQREQQAWRSTSQTVRMLQKASQQDSSSSSTNGRAVAGSSGGNQQV